VRLESTGAVRIAALRVRCAEASPERAALDITAVLDADGAATVELCTTVGDAVTGKQRRAEHRLAEGQNVVSWKAYVDEPRLWWPRALGDAALVDVAVEVTRMDDAQPSHRRAVTTGLRAVRLRRWVLEVNGERLFVKGANHGPTRQALAEAEPGEIERDVVLAQEAGLDLLRIHAHITRPELYDAADRLGLLLWQDLPLQWTYYRGIRGQAVTQAAQAVDLLAHHPSVALWCAHDEPVAVDKAPGLSAAKVLRLAGELVLPTWNKTVLDSSVKRALEKADGTRPVVAHSGVVPHPGSGDSHLWFGWYHGDERRFPAALRALPVLARWVGAFGAQAVPSGRPAFMEPQRWPDLDWDHLARTHNLQKECFDRYVPPDAFSTFEAWRDATQAYQCTVLRHHVEALRRLKYRPTGGFCQFCLADSHPAVTWSVLDHERVPKAGFEALRAACAPVIVTADRPAEAYAPGATVALDVHVVSDLRTPVTGCRVSAVMAWPGGEQRWAWAGDVPRDAVQRIGRIAFQVPDAPGPLTLRLSLESTTAQAENVYESQIR
jgi:beta-mannosidase